jgi:hypothetical protein
VDDLSPDGFSSLPLHFLHIGNTMTKKVSRTTITISRTNYVGLQQIGNKAETFDQIVGRLLKLQANSVYGLGSSVNNSNEARL